MTAGSKKGESTDLNPNMLTLLLEQNDKNVDKYLYSTYVVMTKHYTLRIASCSRGVYEESTSLWCHFFDYRVQGII